MSDDTIQHYDGPLHPLARPAGSDASMFIQWKGTDVCLDFICGECGTQGHFDGMFAYLLGCPECDTIYEMGTQVVAKIISDTDGDRVRWLGTSDPTAPASPRPHEGEQP